MKAGDGSIVARARTVLRTVSVRPAARTPLPATSPISTTTWLSSTHEDVAEVAADELGLVGGLASHAQLEAGDLAAARG